MPRPTNPDSSYSWYQTCFPPAPSLQENGREPDQECAEAKKVEGNACFNEGKYDQAIELYTEAIEARPSCASYYANRAAAYMKLEKYVEALHDAQHAISLDGQLVKGHLREAKCHIALGSVDAASRALQIVIDLEPTISSRLHQEALSEMRAAETLQSHDTASSQAYDDGDFEKVVSHMDTAILHSPACAKFKIRRAEALFKLGEFLDGYSTIEAAIKQKPKDADAHYVKGLGMYYQGNISLAMQYFQEVFNHSADHSRARSAYKECKKLETKKHEYDAFLKSGEFKKAYGVLTQMLADNPPDVIKTTLYGFRAEVQAKLKRKVDAIGDCNKAIELKAIDVAGKEYLDVLRCRAKCYIDLEKYEEAVEEYEEIYYTSKTEKNKDLLEDAKKKLKESKRKDHYKTLGLQRDCGVDDIRSAFKKKARLHHPDRHSDKTPEERMQEKDKFQDVNEANSVLSDPKKKRMYDQKLTHRSCE